MTTDLKDPRLAWALVRYEVVSPYLALAPGRGHKRKLLVELAARQWLGPDGEPFSVSAETLRAWARRYRKKGLEGLMDKERAKPGVTCLTPEQVELVCHMKREVPERSLDRIIKIAEDLRLIEPRVLRRSTIHRVLRAHNISGRKAVPPDVHDLDRFEADAPNDLWQSDMLYAMYLPDPNRANAKRQVYIYAFIDDHSRRILHGRCSFQGDLPALELVFRRCLQKYGRPKRVYYDNGKTYRSHHMRHIVASIGIHRLVFTQRGRPQGHGKIEALNRLIRSAFLAEVKASAITTLDALNEAFCAWADLDYNQQVHSETGQKPADRWRAGLGQVTYVDEEKLRAAFLWRELRTTDKAGCFSLFGTRYQVSAPLARRRIELRYDPEALDLVEVWRDNRMLERVRPFAVSTHRRPKVRPAQEPDEAAVSLTSTPGPTADWLAHLVERRRATFIEEPQDSAHAMAERRARDDQAIFDLLAQHLDPAVLDTAAIRDFLDRFGPFDPDQAASCLDGLFATGERHDRHVSFYLERIRSNTRRTA